ncbi:MAG TPA: hypothetical protein VGK72_00450 [Chthoniobacterales bacterium]
MKTVNRYIVNRAVTKSKMRPDFQSLGQLGFGFSIYDSRFTTHDFRSQ